MLPVEFCGWGRGYPRVPQEAFGKQTVKQAMRGMFGKGGMPARLPAGMDPPQMDPKALEAAAKQLGGKTGLPGLGGGLGLPQGLSGFGKKK